MNNVDENIRLGERIREFRRLRGISLTDLAQRVEISKSFLSQVERGISNPSLQVLRNLALELGVSLPTLFVRNNLTDYLTRREQRQEIQVPGSKVRRQLLVPDTNRETILWHATIPAGAVSSETPTSHAAEECVFILKGTIEVYVGSESIELNEGDTYYIESNLEHYFKNPTKDNAEYLTAGANNFYLMRNIASTSH